MEKGFLVVVVVERKDFENTFFVMDFLVLNI